MLSKAWCIVVAIFCAAFASAQNLYFLSDNKIVRYDLMTDQVVSSFGQGYNLGWHTSPPLVQAKWAFDIDSEGTIYAQGYVPSTEEDTVHLFQAETGTHLSSYNNLYRRSFQSGPDNRLYVSRLFAGSNGGHAVWRFNAATGTGHEEFIPTSSELGNSQLTWLHDGRMFLTDNSSIIRSYDRVTGAFLGVFASSPGGTTIGSLAESPEGVLYASSTTANSILKFDLQTGSFLGSIDMSPGMAGPHSIGRIVVLPNGQLIVHQIKQDISVTVLSRYDRLSGAFLGHLSTGSDKVWSYVTDVHPVPEPASVTGLLVSLGVFASLCKRRKSAHPA